MMQRFVTLAQIPEIRSEPSPADRDSPEVEVLLPVEIYWEIQGITDEIRYARSVGQSGSKYVQKFARILSRYDVNERDRIFLTKGGYS